MRRNRRFLSQMARREEATAYLLVAPTLLIVLLIAVYPLGSGFLKSFTDETFASDKPAIFVGLQNYAALLSIQVRMLHRLNDQGTSVVQYERPEDVLAKRELYRLTDGSFAQLQGASVAPEIIAKLRPLKDREYRGSELFLRELSVALGARDESSFSIVRNAAVKRSIRYMKVAEFSFLGSRFVMGARDPAFAQSIASTLAFTVITVLFETVLGTLLALLLNGKFKGRGPLRALMLVPWAIPTVISSRTWAWMFASTRAGFFNVVLQRLGMGNGQIPFLELGGWQLPIMCIIDIWKTTPFMTLLILAGLQLIPMELYEAAAVDGVRRGRRFWFVTLPLLKQTLAVALVFRTLDALRVFDLFQIVLGESRYSMASYTYYQLIQNRAAGSSSASGVIIFVLIFGFAVLYTRALGIRAHAELE